ncbi:type III restriction enzyme [Pholiota molesta]|nr:type III restriction enzyme [Pholiota molesta]
MTSSNQSVPQPTVTDAPYRYQEEVFEKAQQGNVIAALNTGSGKTLISLLLIKWITSQESSRGKVVIFLVPKVTLVVQQWEYLKNRTPLRIGKLHGAIEASRSLSDRVGWKKLFNNHDVFVMTAQIFLNILTHSLWSLDKVSLMVFDECHHARKNHPYNGIMREYFEVSLASSRPKIFGMTASPIWNVKNPLVSIATLEANLDAKVISVVENVDELIKNSPKATELVIHYPDPPDNYNYPSPTIYECLRVISQDVWNQLDIPWQKTEVRYLSTLWNVGPYCASLFLYLEIQHHLEMILMEHKGQLLEGILDQTEMESVISMSAPQSKPLPEDLFLILDIIDDFKSFFPSNMKSPLIPISVTLDWCTPKSRSSLIFAWSLHRSSAFQGIIFVEQRQIASTLAKVLQVIPELSGKIKCAFIQTDRFHGNPLELFRKRSSTFVQEGLDFPDCELVVRFDELHHMVGYVQSRGRARNRRAATFIVMIQENDIAQMQRFRNLQVQEPKVNLEYQTRHANIQDDDEDEDDDGDDVSHQADLLERERYVEPSTGATITYDNSLNLLNYLCSIIPRDAFTAPHKPKYTEGFIATSLNVFNEYLLPVSTTSDDIPEPAFKRAWEKSTHQNIPPMISVPVRDPWCISDKLWLHPIVIDNLAVAGLITGTALLPEEATIGNYHVETLPAKVLVFDKDSEHECRAQMKEFTRLGIWYNNTSSPFSSSLSLYVVPITEDQLPDFEAIQRLLDNPRGSEDWSQISDVHCDNLIVLNRYRVGTTYLLRKLRHDLSPITHPTYRDFWLTNWSRKKYLVAVPTDGPLLETSVLSRSNIGTYHFDSSPSELIPTQSVRDGRLLPQGSSAWLPLRVLPVLCHRMAHAYRVRCARAELGLAFIPANLIQKHSRRCRSATLHTVHLLNQYPNRHEGQLSLLRQKIVSNKYLMRRALDLGLDSFVNCETPSVYRWRYDCMEALLGASFVTGGISLSLQTGSALGLVFGGPLPWTMRYRIHTEPTEISALFTGLEDLLGYKFRHNHLLLESLTHPSVLYSEAPSYQRLEFLGDAILDLVVVKYLYDKYPEATSHQLALPRTKAICAATLANIAVRKLGLHNRMLLNNLDLNVAIEHYAPILAGVSGAEIVRSGWKFDPPKALTVLVDSGYDYDKTASIVEYVMDDVLEALSPDIAKDPVSEVMEWVAKSGCRQLAFKTELKTTERWERQGITVVVHEQVIVGPIVSASLTVAKFLAADRALAILKDSESEKSLTSLCDCALSMDTMRSSLPVTGPGSLLVDSAELFVDTDDLLDKDIQEVADILTRTLPEIDEAT